MRSAGVKRLIHRPESGRRKRKKGGEKGGQRQNVKAGCGEVFESEHLSLNSYIDSIKLVKLFRVHHTLVKDLEHPGDCDIFLRNCLLYPFFMIYFYF